MEQQLNLEVNIISKEMVKPSLPQPSNPQTFTVSLLDQLSPPIYTSILLVYNRKTPTPQGDLGVDISGLKMALNQTLDQFHPLAGRLLDESTVTCNHQGIPFIETKVNSNLSVVLNSPNKLKLLTECYPSIDQLRVSITEQPLLAIQVNVFLCGGVVIGCYMHHKLMDASSIGTFLEHWSSVAKQLKDNLVQPDFEAALKAFPPSPIAQQVLMSTFDNPNRPAKQPSITNTLMIKSFIFDTVAINKLKANATSKLVPKPSSFEVVAGFIWEQLTSATTDNSGEDTGLIVPVNIRPRMRPPLARGSIGNLLTNVPVKANKINMFQDLVKEIHSVLSNVNQKIATDYQKENVTDASFALIKSNFEFVQKHHYLVTSWCKMGFNDIDFGFGKPAWVVPTDYGRLHPSQKTLVVLHDYHNPITGDYGIEAWLTMEEGEMRVLESNPNFQAFAFPNC